MTISTVYLRSVFVPENFQLTVQKTLAGAKLLKEKYDYDTIAFTGISGAAMAFLLAHELKVSLLCIRKRDDSSHFWGPDYRPQKKSALEGFLKTKRYLIVDDFISSGETVNRILSSIHDEIPDAKCVAMLMYATSGESMWPYFYERPGQQKQIEVLGSRPEGV